MDKHLDGGPKPTDDGLRRALDDHLLGEKNGEDTWGMAKVTPTAPKPETVGEKASPPGARQSASGSGSAAASARILMSESVAVPASRTSLLPRSQDNRSLQLITRFAAGTVILGLEELVKRGQRWEEAAPPEVLAGEGPPSGEEDTYGALLRYWVLGVITSARRSAWSLAVDALEAPGSVAGLIGRTADRVMGSWFFRPVRQPVTSAVNGALSRMVALSDSWIAEGRREEQISRWIATNGINEIVNDVIDMIAENPQLAELVSDQLKGQSVDIATSVADTSRRLSAVTDDAAETFVRRVLRRGVRTDMTSITPHEDPR